MFSLFSCEFMYLKRPNTNYSLVEANPLIMSGCLPTMSLFFRHVSPRLIGESSIRSQSHKPSTGNGNNSGHLQSELNTIDPKIIRAYNRMGDEDSVSIGSDERTEAGCQNDANSVRAIPAGWKGYFIDGENYRKTGDYTWRQEREGKLEAQALSDFQGCCIVFTFNTSNINQTFL